MIASYMSLYTYIWFFFNKSLIRVDVAGKTKQKENREEKNLKFLI